MYRDVSLTRDQGGLEASGSRYVCVQRTVYSVLGTVNRSEKSVQCTGM